MDADTPQRDSFFTGAAVLLGAALVALLSARDYAGGGDDVSRRAPADNLVDHHTLAIDDSAFLNTGDKLYIRGHYYSDKSPVPALLMAGLYEAVEACGGPTVREGIDDFCWCMTVCSSGLAYVAAVWCVWRL